MTVFVLVPSSSVPCLSQLVKATALSISKRLLGSRLIFAAGSRKAEEAVSSSVKKALESAGDGMNVGVASIPVRAANGRSAISAMLDMIARSKMDFGGDEVLVVPVWWYLHDDLDLNQLVPLLKDNECVKAIRLGGWYSKYADGDPIYRLDRFGVNGLLNISSHNCHAIRYFDTNAPQLVKIKFFSDGGLKGIWDSDLAEHARSTDFGSKKDIVFAYPSWFSLKDGDGKTDPFSDVIGTDRAYRDRDARFDKEIEELSGEPFTSPLF